MVAQIVDGVADFAHHYVAAQRDAQRQAMPAFQDPADERWVSRGGKPAAQGRVEQRGRSGEAYVGALREQSR